MTTIPDDARYDGSLSETPNLQVLLLYCSANLEIIDQAKSLRTPTGLYFLAAQLKSHGISVKVDNLSTLTAEERVERLRLYRPTYVGLSMLTLNRNAVMELAAVVKEVLPFAKVFVGGPHASFLAKEILSRVPAIECVVCGEAEGTLPELINCWEQHGDLGRVKGIVYRQGKKIIHNETRPFLGDLSSLPHPAEFFAYENVSTSRGCPFQCGFCSSGQFWGRVIRFHSAKWVVDEIELLYRKHGIREFSFNDDVFTMDRGRVLSICKEIVNRGLFVRFHCMSRVNTLCPERLKWLKRAGCYRIDFGVESGSQRILKAMGKKASVEQARQAFRMTREAGIETGCFLIVGYPGEDDESIEDTKRLVRELRPAFCDISSMAIFPNSPVYLKLLKEKQISPNIWFDMKEHTLFLVEEGKRQRYVHYINDLRADFERNKNAYCFTIPERESILACYHGLGHAALELARALAEHGNFARALQVLTQAVNKEPDNPFLWHDMAELCLSLRDPGLALETVKKAIDLQPQNYESHRLAAKIEAKLGEPDRALDELELAIASRPDKTEAYIERGELLSKIKRWPEALESYSHALRIDPYWKPLKEAVKQCEEQMGKANQRQLNSD